MNEFLSIPGHVPVKEAAAMLGLSEERVLQHIRANHLPARKVAGRYMIPVHAVEEFHRKPQGKTRQKPPEWRRYKTSTVHILTVEVWSYPDRVNMLYERLAALEANQEHTFPGTMQRSISASPANPEHITILLIWKNTEMADEFLLQEELSAFRADFADVLDWETEQQSHREAVAYT